MSLLVLEEPPQRTVIKGWRRFLESAPQGVDYSSSTEQEFALQGEEVDLAERVSATIKAVKAVDLSKANTWFHAFNSSAELVLGWNHGVVLRVGESGWELEWMFLSLKDEMHFAYIDPAYKGIEMKPIPATKEWTVMQLDKPLPISRVTTYNATSCSVSVAFPKASGDRLMICHMDASYPIPFPAMIAWCQAQDSVKKQSCSSKELEEFCVIASICPGDEEKAKFTKTVWFGDQEPTFDFETLLLVRAPAEQKEIATLENHTQFGLVLPANGAPLFGGFLGWPKPAQILSLYPVASMELVFELAAKLQSWDNNAETKATDQLLAPLVNKQNDYWMFHKLCSNMLFAERETRKHPTWSRARMYVEGMNSIFVNPVGPYAQLFSAFLAIYQKKIWMPLSAAQFAKYCE